MNRHWFVELCCGFLRYKYTSNCSRGKLKLLAKRILFFPRLMVFLKRMYCLEKKGAYIELCNIGLVKFQGSLRNLHIGYGSSIGNSTIYLHGQVTIGSCVVINDGVKLLTGTHDINDPAWRLITKNIIIEDYAWIAESVIIMPGTKIGYGSVIAAGSVVRGCVESYSVMAGNPARKVGVRQSVNFDYIPMLKSFPLVLWYLPYSDVINKSS